MQKIKLDLTRFKTKDTKACKYEFQEVARQIITDFNIAKRYQPIIFKHAKNNLMYLKAKAINLRESAEYKGDDVSTYGALLIWSLKKK